MSLPGKTMKIGGYNYHVSDQGAGDKVAFLVHGMPDDGSCWKYQAPVLLKAGYRVIVPDTLGYGGTDRWRSSTTRSRRSSTTCSRSSTPWA